MSADANAASAKLGANDGLRVAVELRRGAFTLRAAFHAPPGLTVLLGPSGAGKSLTLQAIAGLAPVAAGRITLNGAALVDVAAGLALPARLRRIGYVPQSYALFPHLTVAENVAYGLPSALRRPAWTDRPARAERDRRIAALLQLAQLPGFAARRPDQLSGGEAQRVALARALAAEPAALLLDEPLSALDASTRAAVRDDLRAILAASGAPTILVTHDLAEARALGDRIVALVGGRVVAAGALTATLACPPTTTAARLFGWGAILPVTLADAPSRTATSAPLRVTLATGQSLTLDPPASDTHNDTTADHATPDQPAPRLALALRAERITLRLAQTTAGDDGAPATPTASGATKRTDMRDAAETTTAAAGATLVGVVSRVADEGAFYRVSVALSEAPGAPTAGATIVPAATATPTLTTVIATCSPREWESLGLAVGARVQVCAPPGAARLVVVDE